MLISIISTILCAIMFIQSAREINKLFNNNNYKMNEDLTINCINKSNYLFCVQKYNLFHTIIVCISLIECLHY